MDSTAVSRAMKGIFCARRIRATICPIRPMPAMTTRGLSVWISRYSSGTSTGLTLGLIQRARAMNSNGVTAIDKVMVNTSMSYSPASNSP